MGDDRKFQPVVGRFEDTYGHYHGGGLVAVVLRIVEGLITRWNGQWFPKRVDRQGMLGAQD